MRKSQQQKNRPLRKAESAWSVDPLSDLVSASELAAWRRDLTTQKILRYLNRWREQVKEYMGEGGTIATTTDATAAQTVEASSKVQILGDIINLDAKAIADFYELGEPQDEKAKH